MAPTLAASGRFKEQPKIRELFRRNVHLFC